MNIFSRFQTVVLVFLVALLLSMAACKEKIVQPPASSAPPPIFTGPEAFYSTVGSMVQAEGLYPLLVSGYSIVANLPEETGSREVPQNLRLKLVNDMRRLGFGSARLGMGGLTPQRVLDRLDTAVVRVDGLIPPAATKGTRFDVIVTALDGTQTTSLEGGMLFTAELAPGGARIVDMNTFRSPLANANGATYINPFEDDADRAKRLELSRQAAVLSGGVVTVNRRIRLILNQPSWTRCRAIADRINERFRRSSRDRDDTASAKNESVIELNIPSTWQADPQRLLSLVMNLYVQRGSEFDAQKAAELGELAMTNPEHAPRVAYAWETLGRTALPVVRRHYDSRQLPVRLAALTAGVHLGDERTSEHLEKLSESSDQNMRLEAAKLMVFLPDSLRAEASLRRLLSDPDHDVRIAAYKALSKHGDRRHIQNTKFYDADNRLKFILDIVDTDLPLIYISQTDLPRIVVFNGYTGFQAGTVAAVWDHRLMVKAPGERQPAEVFFQAPGKKAKTETIAPALANFVVLLARDPQRHPDFPSFGLPYSRVVNAVYQMHRDGHFGNTPLILEQSPLATRIAEAQRTESVKQSRPEFDDTPTPTPAPGSDPGGDTSGEVSDSPYIPQAPLQRPETDGGR